MSRVFSLRMQPGELAITAWTSGPREVDLALWRVKALAGVKIWEACALRKKINPQSVVHGTSFDQRYFRAEPHVFDESAAFTLELERMMAQYARGKLR